MKHLILFIFFIVVFAGCGKKYNPEITAGDIKTTVEYLASDSLKGRKPGTDGSLLAAKYIGEQFENASLEMLNDNGFQKFGLVSAAEFGEGNMLETGKTVAELENEMLEQNMPVGLETGVSLKTGVNVLMEEEEKVLWIQL